VLRKRKLTLAAVFFTFFVDNLCWSIVFPIFAPYFLDPHNRLFSSDISITQRTTIFGLFLMAFSLGQFFGSPVLGEYADRSGRKKALGVSIFFTFIGLGLSALSMQLEILWLLFVSRLLTGVFASNIPICLACVVDLSPDEKTKAKLFGYLSVFAGLSFIVGAFLGGKLSDPSLNPLFSPYLPLWLAAGLTVINFLFILFAFRETAEIHPDVKFDFLEGFHNIQEALKTEKIKRFYLIYFLFLFAWTLLFQFIPVLVVERYQFTNSNIGDLAIFMGICWAIGSGYLNRFLQKKFSPMLVLEVCLIAFTLLCALIVIPKHLWGLLTVLGFSVILAGLAWPLCTGVISNLAPRQIQGKILGISQSMQSLAMSIAPVVGGLAYRGKEGLPFLIAAGAGLLASIIYFSAVKKR
jgi:MFS family permease